MAARWEGARLGHRLLVRLVTLVSMVSLLNLTDLALNNNVATERELNLYFNGTCCLVLI